MSQRFSYDQCLVIINPGSTRSRHAVKQLSILEYYFGKKDINRLNLKERDFSHDRRLRKAISALSDKGLVVVVGGDGTINRIVHVMLGLARREMTVLPLAGGNASDIAHMLHGRRAVNLKRILAKGQRRVAYALDVRIDDEQLVALAYASFGATAAVMQHLDGLSRRHHSLQHSRLLILLSEIYLATATLIKTPRFKLSINGHPPHHYYDLLCINGSRIAKLYRTHARLTHPEFIRLVIRYKHPIVLRHLWRFSKIYRRRRTTIAPQILRFYEDTPAQIDGEVRTITAGTTVTIAKEVQPYYVLSCTS